MAMLNNQMVGESTVNGLFPMWNYRMNSIGPFPSKLPRCPKTSTPQRMCRWCQRPHEPTCRSKHRRRHDGGMTWPIKVVGSCEHLYTLQIFAKNQWNDNQTCNNKKTYPEPHWHEYHTSHTSKNLYLETWENECIDKQYKISISHRIHVWYIC